MEKMVMVLLFFAFTDWINRPLFEMIQESKKGTLTFKEQEEMLPILAEMGIKTIYLTPIWKYKPGTPLNRYYILDYYELDPAKGTEEDFKHFVETAHSYGIKVILDLVTAHTGPDRCIYENHKDWILRDKHGNLVYCWPNKQWGYAVDRANPEVIEYFTEIAKYYVDEFGIDGWRMDAIGTQHCNESIPDCPQPVEGEHHSKYLLESIKSALGEDKALYLEWCYLGRMYLYIVGVEEENGCPCPNPIPCSLALPELNECADASYSYEFGKCFMFNDIIPGKSKSKDFIEFFKRECLYYKKPRGRFLMTHDVGYHFYEENPELHKVGAVLITTIPGFPHIYHREIFPEGDIGLINQEMFDLYKKLIEIKEEHLCLQKDSIENALIYPDTAKLIAYNRWYKNEVATIVVNLNDEPFDCILKTRFEKESTVYDMINNESFTVDNPDSLSITISQKSARILIGEVTGIGGNKISQSPSFLTLPNPFTESMVISYNLPVEERVNIEIYNLLGQRIKTLLDREQSSGYHTVVWDKTDDSGRRVTCGVYFCTLKAGNSVRSQKLLLLR